MALEFMPWYGTTEQMVRCGGDGGCGALLMDGDTEMHQDWHDKVWPHIEISYVVNVNPPAEPGEIAEQVVETMTLAKRRP